MTYTVEWMDRDRSGLKQFADPNAAYTYARECERDFGFSVTIWFGNSRVEHDSTGRYPEMEGRLWPAKRTPGSRGRRRYSRGQRVS